MPDMKLLAMSSHNESVGEGARGKQNHQVC